MDVAVFIVAIIAAAAAIAAAVFGYPAWRQSRERPDVVISARHRQFSTSPEGGDVALDVETENLAAAPARDWHVTLESHGLEVHLRRENFKGASERRTATDWRIDWQADGDADSIGKGNTRRLPCRTGTMGWEQTAVARYWLSARGMETRSGETGFWRGEGLRHGALRFVHPDHERHGGALRLVVPAGDM
jgi:hypothetical protein